MNELVNGFPRVLLLEIGAACLVVFGAMCLDLASGLYKAHLAGKARRSEALKRSAYKFITYEGALLIAGGIDLLLWLAHLWQMFHINLLEDVPCFTFIIAIFLCVVEIMSIRERADEKMRSEMERAEKLATRMSDHLVDIIADRLREKGK